MRRVCNVCVFAILLFVAGCNGASDGSTQMAAWNQQYQAQLDKTDQQLKRLDQLHGKFEAQIGRMGEVAAKQKQQAARYERLLARWEKQADRYDGILTKWEKAKMPPVTGI